MARRVASPPADAGNLPGVLFPYANEAGNAMLYRVFIASNVATFFLGIFVFLMASHLLPGFAPVVLGVSALLAGFVGIVAGVSGIALIWSPGAWL